MPFLKCDKGLEDEANGVQLMKPMGDLDGLLSAGQIAWRFRHQDALGHQGGQRRGIKANVAQQFEIGRQILGHGLVPIIEPEVNITISDKAEAEAILRDEIMKNLDAMDQEVMLKLSLPSEANFYADAIAHDRTACVLLPFPAAIAVRMRTGCWPRTPA